MVLQNKYKAKASRRYNSSKASTDDADPSSSKPGYRHRFANKHGRKNGLSTSHDGQQESDDDDDEDDSQEGSVGSSQEEDGDAEFPSLAKAAATSDSSRPLKSEQGPSIPSRGKYARRKLGESKLARLERLEAAKDPRLPDDEEPEPEVDISNLVARVAALGDSAGTQAGIAEEIARSRGQHETASDVENDIDHSLAYLHEKERQRQKAKGRGGAVHSPLPDEASKVALEALNVDADGNAINYEELQKEKEKAEAVRALKARFQGHGVGERRADGKARAAPSIQIGPQAASSSKTASSETDGVPTNGTLSDSLTAEIESSLAKACNSSSNGETASVNLGRSSFSTTFGHRKSPLAATNPSSQAERPHSGSSPASHRTERIDSFLFSLNDRSVAAGKDPSVFSLSSPGFNGGDSRSSPQLNRSSNHFDATTMAGQKGPIHSTPGELGRLESFLDDMLG